MKGFAEIHIENRPLIIIYTGEHYAIRNIITGRTTRMAKDKIIKKFHLHRDALDRHIAGGFKKCRCNADEDIVSVKRGEWDVYTICFYASAAVGYAVGLALIALYLMGYTAEVRECGIQALAGIIGFVLINTFLPDALMRYFPDFAFGIKREA